MFHCGYLRIEIGQGAHELVAITRILATLQCSFDPSPRQEQHLHAAVRFYLF